LKKAGGRHEVIRENIEGETTIAQISLSFSPIAHFVSVFKNFPLQTFLVVSAEKTVGVLPSILLLVYVKTEHLRCYFAS
jgi:hypothetical protein